MKSLTTSKLLFALFLLLSSMLACSRLGLGSSSPTSSFKAFYEAQKKKAMYFVKEDGDWKVALDKTLTEGLKNLGQ